MSVDGAFIKRSVLNV